MTQLQKFALRAVALLTSGLRQLEHPDENRLPRFLRAKTRQKQGAKTPVVVLRRAFLESLPPEEREAWGKRRFADELRKYRAVQVGTGNKLTVLDTQLK